MPLRKIIKNGIKVVTKKDRFGKYFIMAAYPSKRPPENNFARRNFYKINNLGKRIDRLNNSNKKFMTITSLRNFIK